MTKSVQKWLQDIGRKGGKARAKKLTAAQRSASARHAITERWRKVKEHAA